MLPSLLGLASKVNTLLDRMSSDNATAIEDNLDSPVSDCAQTSDGWDAALATKLDAMAFTSQSIEFTTPATSSWTVPAGVSLVWLSMCGGGASGQARVQADNATAYTAEGGAAASSIIRMPYKVTAGASISYTVGVGGTGPSRSSDGTSNHDAGTDSVFGTITAPAAPANNIATTWITSPTTLAGGDGQDTGTGPGETVNPLYPGGASDITDSYHEAYGGGGSYFGIGGDGVENSPGATGEDGERGGGGGAAFADTGNTATAGSGGDGYILVEWVGPAS